MSCFKYILLYPSMINNIYNLISDGGVGGKAYIDIKNILHLVSYISAGVPYIQ